MSGKREYTGEPIDMTNARGETHLSEVDGETVAGTTAENDGSEVTEYWPSELPREEFTDLQAAAVKQMVITPDACNEAVASAIDSSSKLVNGVRQKISVLIDDVSDVPFDVPEPGDVNENNRWVQPYVQDSGSNGNSDRTQNKTREVLGRYHKLDQSPAEIAAKMDAVNTIAEVNGTLSATAEIPEDKWVVPPQENEDGVDGGDATVSEGLMDDSVFDVATTEPDLLGCDCEVPQLCVESATAGPSQIQSLHCSRCKHEFSAIYQRGGDK